MHDTGTSCQLGVPPTGETSRYAPHPGGTQCPTNGHTPTRLQWLSTTPSRHAGDPFSWMQAVHWTHGSGHYTKTRSHGPTFNTTTVRVAQALARLTPCRPGIDYLARVLKLSERSVQYHLEMLRETGLLAYIVRGNRTGAGLANQASEFARVIPPAFDEALGIRTIGEGVQRRPVGIADTGRSTIGKLAKKAARKIRKPRRKTHRPGSRGVFAGQTLCTPKQGGTSTSSTADVTGIPSEAKLASGDQKSHPAAKKPRNTPRRPRKLNKVGRRHQLARELIQRVWWLHRANPQRIAWIVRHVADHQWTADEVIAWLNLMPDPRTARRPSGFLANRLRDAASCPGWKTPEQRRERAEEDRDSRQSVHHRHTDTHATGNAPASPAVRRIVAEAIIRAQTPSQARPDDGVLIDLDTAPLTVDDLTRAEVLDLRATADRDPAVIGLALDTLGERDTRRLYTNARVDRYLRPVTGHTRIHTYQQETR